MKAKSRKIAMIVCGTAWAFVGAEVMLMGVITVAKQVKKK